ncbi:RAD51-associated protein 1 isoform X2 [Rhinichthys klamathensis goyatoka]|uniref:RAD51-associated protein 1 isoform X2 n=1 Tax=Rhinichthys klamathensis goyatoka TaxID=3034132 RepID=UPI0024B624A2|nr:RAD51-associated protein 1 isoform X2 [Rhinichthys klamathensis goyatoka]
MDRPSRNRKAVNYSVFQDDDDEDFTCVKPPPKKARTAVSERNQDKTTSASPNEVVILTSSGSRKRTSLDDKLYDRDLETALTLSLLNSPGTQDGEPTTKTDDCDVSQPAQCSPPVLIHCSADASHLDDSHPHPDFPPVLSNCCIDGRSLGLNLISMDASTTNVSKQTDASEEQSKPLKEKDNKVDEDYQPQNTPDSESDADFTEEDESEDETFTVKKIKVVKLKTEKKAPPPVKDKKEKKDKKPTKASKAKTSAPSPAICRSPAAPVSGLKKTPNTPPISKPALCSSPAGGKLPKWNPPGLVGRSPGASQNTPMKSPGQGLRLGLSRRARIKPLHQNAAVN